MRATLAVVLALCVLGAVVSKSSTTSAKRASSSLPGKWGYLTANSTYQVEYFYWMFAPVAPDTPTTPLVFWLTGGPGCSSLLAAFFENGPYKVDGTTNSLVPHRYGWNQKNYIVYVDQPGGTGFSTVGNSDGYVTGETEVALDFYNFIGQFYAKYPNLASRPLYIIGESYGGHYVPAIAAYIAAQGQYPLKGIGVGNGWTMPSIQTASYGPFVAGHGFMTQAQLAETQALVPACQQDIASGDYYEADADCGAVLQTALSYCAEAQGRTCNVYNLYAPCVGSLCYDLSNITTFLNTPSVQQQLGVNVEWGACNSDPYGYLVDDIEKSFRHDVPALLAAGVKVTIYNGNYDLICNFYGTHAYLRSMEWPGQNAFAAAKNTTWLSSSGKTYGNYRHAQGLTFVVVNAAGHMVPHDQPQAALDLVTRILNANW